MNLKTTLVLLVLVGAGVGLFWVGLQLPPWADPFPTPPAVADLGSRGVLKDWSPDKIQRIEVIVGDQTTLLQRDPEQHWTLPGNWPIRQAEVNALVQLIGNLRSRFQPLPLDPNKAETYGMDKPRAVVNVVVAGHKHRLRFSEPAGMTNRFEKPVYVQIDDREEVLRLAPGLVGLLDHPMDYYQQRRLFPSQRLARDSKASKFDDRLSDIAGQQLQIKSEEEGKPREITLQSDGTTWSLTQPGRDHADITALQSLLTTIPDIWAERFIRDWLSPALLAVTAGSTDLAGGLTAAAWFQSALRPAPFSWQLRESGLDKPERTISYRDDKGRVLTLEIGRVARKTERRELQPAPPNPMGFPSRPIEVSIPETYYYARLKGNDQIFEIRDDRLAQVFVPLDRLRDARVVNSTPDKVRRIELANGPSVLDLVKDTEADSKESWKIKQAKPIPAETTPITDLLQALTGLEARGKDVLYNPDLTPLGLNPPAAQVTLTVVDEEKKDEKPEKTRSIVLQLGKEENGKLPVRDTSTGRVSLVSNPGAGGKDDLLAQVRRPAAAWRNKQILDLDTKDLSRITINHPGDAAGLTLEQTDKTWTVLAGKERIQPEPILINQMIAAVGKLEAQEFVGDIPSPLLALAGMFAGMDSSWSSSLGNLGWVKMLGRDSLDFVYGLGTPRLSINLTFSSPKHSPQTLLLGKATPSGTGIYARLADDPTVFVVSPALLKTLDVDVLVLVPQTLWDLEPAAIDSVRIVKQGQPAFELLRKDAVWKLSGPGDALAETTEVNKLVPLLAHLHCERYQALDAKEMGLFGLDKPETTITLKVHQSGKVAATEHILEIGKPVGTNGDHYARVDHGTRVFVLAPGAVQTLTRGFLDLVDRQVLKFDPASSQSFKRTDAAGALEIVRREDRWVITKPVEEPADDKEMETLWKTLGTLRALRIAALSPTDVKSYGLDAPLATITLDLSPDQKPNQVVLKIGKAVAEATGEHFAQVVGHPSVVVLPASLIRTLRAAPLTFRDRVLTKLPGFDTLRLERDRRKATFALGKDSWMLTEPLRAEANTTLLDDFLTALSNLHADELVQDKPTADDLKKYGLDSPLIRYQVLDKGKELLDLQVGGVEKNGARRYARIGKRDLVFLLDPKLSTVVLEEFRPRTVWDMPLDAAEVNQVRFGWAKSPFTLSRVRSNWQVSDKPKTLVNPKAVDDMLGVLAGLKLERYVIDKDADLQLYGLKTPEVTLIAKTNTGQWGLRIGSRVGDSRARYAQLDQPGKTDVFLIAESDAGRIIKELDALVEK